MMLMLMVGWCTCCMLMENSFKSLFLLRIEWMNKNSFFIRVFLYINNQLNTFKSMKYEMKQVGEWSERSEANESKETEIIFQKHLHFG